MINQVCFHSCGISIILLVSELDLKSIDPVLSVVSKAGAHVHVCMRISSPSCSSITTTEYAKLRILLNRSCAANK